MIELTLQEDASAKLGEAASLLDDLTPVMNEIGEYMVEATRKRFAAGVGPDGVPWAPKSPATLDAARRNPLRGNDPRPLHSLGILRDSTFYQAGHDHVEIGSNRIYAGVMQFGAEAGAFGAFVGKDKRGRDHFHSIPWGDIPARPFLGIDDTDSDFIVAAVSDWIRQAFD
jgi:phage gpG-like protein